jgi:hypothetical protein
MHEGAIGVAWHKAGAMTYDTKAAVCLSFERDGLVKVTI